MLMMAQVSQVAASTKLNRWRAVPLAVAFLFASSAVNIASADVPAGANTLLGTASFTFANPGNPTTPNGGGPFNLTLTSKPAGSLPSLSLPASVQSWCVEISENISTGANSDFKLYSMTASKIGGLLQFGKDWLNVTSSTVSFKAGISGLTGYSSWFDQTSDADAVGAAIQQAIWSVLLGTAVPPSIDGHAGAPTFVQALIDNAKTLSYYRLHKHGVQDQVFTVPGPMVGAGIPGLVIAFGGFVAWYRRRRPALA
jgi:hypothetical protein